MYLGVSPVKYFQIESKVFEKMEWDQLKGSNYLEEAFVLVEKYFETSIIFKFQLKTLLSFILENVHDHGCGSCNLIIGKTDSGLIIEIFEEQGGFDLNKLPYGKGGCGFRVIKKSKCKVSHSKNGKSTYIVVPN